MAKEISHQVAGAPGTAVKTSVSKGERILEMDAVLRTLGFIFYNSLNVHWFSASDKKQTMAEGCSLITSVLEKHERLRFTADDREIKINGEAYEPDASHTRALVDHLSVLGGCNFIVAKGLTQEEFTGFMELISRKPEVIMAEGGFIEMVTKVGYPHIISKKIVLQEVSEEEVVVSKTDFERAEAEEKQKIESDVLTFLKAEESKASESQAKSLTSAMQDSERMADLVMQAAGQKPGESAADKKEVAKVVVECLDRAFEALVDDPFSRTQKGKQAIAKALQRLETELLSKMHAAPDKEDGAMVSGAVERMTERLKMDSIVQDYSRKLKALEQSEKKILRFMKLQGLDRVQDVGLQSKLNDEGVDVSQWHHLLVSSGAGSENADEAALAVSQLAALLSRLEEDVGKIKESGDPAATEEALSEDLKKVGKEMAVLTQQTQSKIDDLADAVSEDMAAVEALEKLATQQGSLKLPRKKILAVMVEVVQELCQPLAAISCSVQMLRDKMLGDVTASQVEILDLVLESAERIRTLVRNLEKVSGLPSALSPNQEITGMLNKPVV